MTDRYLTTVLEEAEQVAEKHVQVARTTDNRVSLYILMPATTANVTDTNISWLKPEQVEAMRDAAYDGRHGTRDDAIVTTLYDTGLRRLELSRVDRDMLDLDDGVLRIPPRIQKQYPNDNDPSARTIRLDRGGMLRTGRTLRAWLDDHPGTDALFPSQ